MEFELLKDVPDIEITRRQNKYIDPLLEWEKTDNKCIKFVCKNQAEKTNCASALANFFRKTNRDYTIYREKGKFNVYVIRA